MRCPRCGYPAEETRPGRNFYADGYKAGRADGYMGAPALLAALMSHLPGYADGYGTGYLEGQKARRGADGLA